MDSLPYVDLPKWSKIVVSGKDVTPDQAAEIILRTSDLHFSCNDRDWRRQLHTYLNVIPADNPNNYTFADSDKMRKVEDELGILQLEYLQNDQMASCYIGGPHGWCSWDGTIGCDGHAIGKWPSVKHVYEEWKQIAETWPFLNLRCQLWNDEQDNNNNNNDNDDDYYNKKDYHRPVVEFHIKDCNVTVREPKGVISHYNKTPMIGGGLLRYGGECGCDFSKFKEAVELARKSVQLKSKNKESEERV